MRREIKPKLLVAACVLLFAAHLRAQAPVIRSINDDARRMGYSQQTSSVLWLQPPDKADGTSNSIVSQDSMPVPDNGSKPSSNEDSAATSARSTEPQASARSAFPAEQVARGRTAFETSCVDCHDADRSLRKRKSRAGWLATVRRMAKMDGADIDRADLVPIATYLASLSAPASQNRNDTESDGGPSAAEGSDDTDNATEALSDAALLDEIDEGLGSTLSLSATVSTLARGGNDNLENPGFFVDAWLRADWQPSGPIRGRVTACTSCHSDQTGDGGFTLELVEATAVWDMLYRKRQNVPEHCQPQIDLELKAGRFVVPFGAFAGMSHPGIYRTLTNPLMYNMGRQVNPVRSQPPVLPAPYSDEGVDLYARIPLRGDWTATMDVYGVNGLQGSATGVQFTPSRSYADNNAEPAVGGRATVGTNRFRFGGSVMSGRMHDDATSPLHYRLAGADVTGRFFDDLVRVYFEYAMRRNDTAFDDDQLAYGTTTEMEVRLLDQPNLNALVRYDTLEHRGQYGEDTIERYTWGFSTSAIGGSLLLLNHEHWNFGYDETDVDVVGFRWVATF